MQRASPERDLSKDLAGLGMPCAPRGASDRGPAAWRLLAATGLLLVLAGCSRTEPESAEQAAARALEAQGAKAAQVQIQGDSFRATLTQSDGREAQMAVGSGTVNPTDFGVPWYPGAQADAQRSSRLGNADGQVATVVLQTTHGLPEVSAFYRDRLAPQEGRAVRESTTPEGAVSFVVADEAAGSATQVVLQAVAGGVEVTLLTTRRAPR